jgi:hypothetical protein
MSRSDLFLTWLFAAVRHCVGAFLAAAVFAASADASQTVAVEGEGYMRFTRDGRAVYAKSATLEIQGGELREKGGVSFLPAVRLPAAAQGFSVDEHGWVLARTPSGESRVARLLLARFASGVLEPSGSFLLARDRAILGYAGAETFGTFTVSGAAKTSGPFPPLPAADRVVSGALVIQIGASVMVDKPRMTLRDIAQVHGADAERVKAIDLGVAPVHGIPMSYARERLLSKVLLLGLDRAKVELQMPAAVEIRRAGQIVQPQQILEAAKAAVAEKTGLKGELETSDRLAEIHVPNGTLELAAESVSLISGAATVTVGIRVDGRRIIGRTVRLSGPMLEPAVQAGSNVTVRFLSNGVTVELPGRVRSSAAVGQSVEVTVQAGTGSAATTHVGTVIAPGKVEVKL